MKALVVEDNQSLCDELRLLLNGSGMEARVFRNGLDADGNQILGWLRKSPKHKELPSIVCSALSSPEEASRAKKAGADNVLSRPFRPFELIEVVRRVTQGSRNEK